MKIPTKRFRVASETGIHKAFNDFMDYWTDGLEGDKEEWKRGLWPEFKRKLVFISLKIKKAEIKRR